MIQKIISQIKKHWLLILVLIFIISLGTFLRSFHHSDWLHFQLDQSRDAEIISQAHQNGPQELPLLGARAGGSFLRLGPIFYYFEYFSSLIFGDNPPALAYPDLLFGILFIPLFYFFIRRYFDLKTSLGLTFLISISFFLIAYSRFAWNPNSLPFFVLLSLFSALKATEAENKNKGYWLLICALSLSIASQLHFLAFIILPIILIIYLIIKRPRIALGWWIGAISIGLFLYSPVLINDIKTGGESINQFIVATQLKSDKKGERNAIEVITRNINENSLSYFSALSGSTFGELPKNKKISLKKIEFSCMEKCLNPYRLAAGFISLIFFISGVFLLFKNLLKEKITSKKDFLIITTLWFVLSFIFFAPLSFDLSMRFFLLVAAIPFIFFGFLINAFKTKISDKTYMAILILAIGLFAIANIWKIEKTFNSLSSAPFDPGQYENIVMPKKSDYVTLGQQLMIINFMISKQEKNDQPIYINSELFYKRSFNYHLDKRGIPRDNFDDNSTVYGTGNFFLILPYHSNWKEDLKKYETNYQLINKNYFGTLLVFEMKPRKEKIEIQEGIVSDHNYKDPDTPQRYRWKDVFGN